MTTDRIGKLLERVALELWMTPGIDGEVESDWIPLVASSLETELGPLLRAGQAMRETLEVLRGKTISCEHWDAALATLEGRDAVQD